MIRERPFDGGAAPYPDLIAFIEHRLRDWETGLFADLNIQADLKLHGSLRSGHITSHELAQTRPVDCDILMTLPATSDPSDPELKRRLVGFFDASLCSLHTFDRWDRSFPSLLLRRFEGWREGIELKWEVCVINAPYLDVCRLWDAVFSREEIAWQARVRDSLRGSEDGGTSLYTAVKSLQCEECRWRIVASYALSRAVEGSVAALQRIGLAAAVIDPPLRGEPPAVVAQLVELFLKGDLRASTLNRPISQLPLGARLLSDFAEPEPSLIEPECPVWVVVAERLQAALWDTAP